MAITRTQQAKQLLNKVAPKGEKLAYINDKEAKLLKKMGGAGIDVNGTGIKSYVDFGGGGSGYGSAQDTFDSAAGRGGSRTGGGGSRSDTGGSYDQTYQQSVRTNQRIAAERAAAVEAQRQEEIRKQKIITEAIKEGKKTTLQKVAPKTFKIGTAATKRVPVDAYIERDRKSQERFNRENNRMLLNTVKYGGNLIAPGLGTVASFAVGRDLDKKAAIEAQISNARLGGSFYTGPINAGSYNTKTGLYDAAPTRNPDVTSDGDNPLIPRPFMVQPSTQEVIEEEPTPYDFDLYAARDNRVAKRFAQGGRTGFNMGGMEEENLQAGAPNLTIEGNQIPQQEEMASAPGIDAELYQLFLDALRKGDIPQGTTFDAYKQLMMEVMSQQQGGQMQAQMMEPEMQEGIMQAQMMEPEREMAAFGGMMGSDGRRAYGIGSFFKKAKRAVKKVLKSPIAKAALLAAGTFKLGGGKFSQIGSTGGSGFKFGNLPGAGFFKNSQNEAAQKLRSNLSLDSENAYKIISDPKSSPEAVNKALQNLDVIQKRAEIAKSTGALALNKKTGMSQGINLAATLGIPAIMAGVYSQGKADEKPMDANTLARIEGYNNPLFEGGIGAARARILAGDNTGFNFRGPDSIYAAQGGRIGYQDAGPVQPQINRDQVEMLIKKGADNDLIKTFVDGALDDDINQIRNEVQNIMRNNKAEGGLMNLGGNEMDLRGGGFVPLGAKEKADDVPARLSKNEFVFTADAVRAAGGGSVDKGAEKMYNTMKRLEGVMA